MKKDIDEILAYLSNQFWMTFENGLKDEYEQGYCDALQNVLDFIRDDEDEE